MSKQKLKEIEPNKLVEKAYSAEKQHHQKELS
jgi:hypothetical protein